MSDASSKPLLRAEMKSRRKAMAQAGPLAGEALAERATVWLDAHGWPPRPAVVAGYWPIQSEMNPFPLMEAFTDRGYGLALPALAPADGGFTMEFRRFRIGDLLATGPFGLVQPEAGAAPAEPDLVLLPLLAFTVRGQRLGYGGGYYDRALETLRSRRAVAAWGIAFSAQQLADLPFEAHDQPLDGVFTDQGVIEARP